LITMAKKGSNSSRIISPTSVLTLVVPIVAFVAALLSGSTLFLNYVHVMIGATWTGIDLFMGLVMTRVMSGLDPPARVQVVKRMVPIMLFFMPGLAAVTITAGMYLAMWEGLFILRSSLIIATIALVSLLTIQGFGILLPNEVRVYLELRKENPDNEKIVRLGLRNIRLAGIQVIFQIALIFVMANLAFVHVGAVILRQMPKIFN
jgi:hypothetical protein